MTIRRRLTLAFLAILMLFAVNQAFQLWNVQLRTRTMETLDRALKRQVVMALLHETVDNLRKQVSLLSEIQGGGEASEARRLFHEEVDRAAAQIRELKDLGDAGERPAVAHLEQTYGNLAEAWRKFYEYLGVEQGWALAYQVRAEALSRDILVELLPQLQRQYTERVQQAETEFATVTRLTER